LVDIHPYAEAVRNTGLEEARGDWILMLDPDERVSRKLASEIRELVTNSSAAAYAIPRKNLIFGIWARTMGWWPDSQTRLFRAGAASYVGRVHETATIRGAVHFLPEEPAVALVHVNYVSLAQFVEKLNRYTTAIATNLDEAGVRFQWWKLAYRPGREFLKRFVLYGGAKQGVFGLLLSGLMGCYEFVTWAKLWELQRPARASDAGEKDIA
jgi:glycosyltransferase involved in cell wall biosynthesis